MKKFKVYYPCDYFVGHLRYGHGEAIIEAETEEEAREKAKEWDDIKPIVDDYELSDHDRWDIENIEIEEIIEDNLKDVVKYNQENEKLEISKSVIDMLKDFERQKVEFGIKEQKLKEQLFNSMEKYGVNSWESPDKDIKIIYKKATTKKTIDSARLRQELPDVAEEYTKVSDVKPSISISIEV